MVLMNNKVLRKHVVKGSITVEASLVVPIVVFCILPFIYLFRMLLFQMVMEKGVDECVKQMAVEMYVLERISILPECDEEEEKEIEQTKVEQVEKIIEEYTAFFEDERWKEEFQEWGYELAGELLLREKLQAWLETEKLSAWGVKDEWSGISVSESDFLYTEDGHHYLIKGAVSFEWMTPFSFWKPKTISVQRVYHCFVGEDWAIAKEEGEEGDNNDRVVCLIGNGTKYHSSSCYLINKNVYTSTRSSAEKGGKQPCGRCKPYGSITVYQTKGGGHYHMEKCSYLNPDVISMKWEKAVGLGYTGCGLCQEENRYFS